MQAFTALDELSKKLTALMPQPLKSLQADMETNVRGLLESGLQKMNLVTREEFEIQSAVLQKTRAKLEALEQRLAALENISRPTATTHTDSMA